MRDSGEELLVYLDKRQVTVMTSCGTVQLRMIERKIACVMICESEDDHDVTKWMNDYQLPNNAAAQRIWLW